MSNNKRHLNELPATAIYPILKEYASNQTILLIDDSDKSSSAICSVLNELTFTVDMTKDSDDALRLFREKRHNIVIADIDISNQSILELCREIKRININQPLIVMTHHREVDTVINLMHLGVNECMFKPFQNESLVRNMFRISMLINEHKEQEEYITQLLYDYAELNLINKKQSSLIEKLQKDAKDAPATTNDESFAQSQMQDSAAIEARTYKQDILDEYSAINATDFLASFVIFPDNKISALEGGVEQMIFASQKLQLEYSSGLSEQLSQALATCSSSINCFMEFKEISIGLQDLAESIEKLIDSKVDSLVFKNMMLKKLFVGLSEDLSAWMNSIFVYKNVDNIYYLHKTLTVSFEMIKRILEPNILQAQAAEDSDIELV